MPKADCAVLPKGKDGRKVKKLLKTALVLCFFLITFSAGAVAPKAHAEPIAWGAIGNTILSWSLEDNGDLTIRTSDEGQKGYIPDYSPNSTADFRQYKDQIKRVVWKRGVSVTSIGERAFEDCVNLESMEIPADVASVGAYAFQGCTSLASVTFSSEKYSNFAAATEISIGNRAFGNCPALGTVSMQNTVTSVSSTAFTGSDNVKVHVPDYNGAAARAVSNATHFYVGSDTAWGIRYYGDVLNLRKYTGTAASASLPAYVTAIYSDTAFTGSALKALTVTDSLASVGAYQGFGYAEGALRIYVPTPNGSAAKAVCNAYGNQLKVYFVIGTDMALQYNSSKDVVTLRAYTGSAENVVIPAYIDAIYESAFGGNTTMKTVTMTSVKSMGKSVFRDCAALETATLGEGLTAIPTQAFVNCVNLTSVSIPATVTSIGGDAFIGCTSLPSLTLTDNVTEIGPYGMCPAEVRVYVPTPIGNAAIAVSNAYQGGHDYYVVGDDSFALRCSGEGVVTLRAYTGSKTDVVLPAYVSTLVEYAFANNTTLQSVVLTGVTQTNMRAFWKCTALRTVLIGDGLTAIKTQDFAGCTNLESVVIPDSVTSITDSAFDGADNVCLTVGCDSYAKTWAIGKGFAEDPGDGPVTGRRYLPIHTWTHSPSTAAAESTDGVRGGIFCSVCHAVQEADRVVSAQKVLKLPAMAKQIEAEAFMGISARQVVIPAGTISLGEQAFADCGSLLIAVIPISVNDIAENAFAGTDIAVICPADSYAAAWCDDHHIPHNP